MWRRSPPRARWASVAIIDQAIASALRAAALQRGRWFFVDVRSGSTRSPSFSFYGPLRVRPCSLCREIPSCRAGVKPDLTQQISSETVEFGHFFLTPRAFFLASHVGRVRGVPRCPLTTKFYSHIATKPERARRCRGVPAREHRVRRKTGSACSGPARCRRCSVYRVDSSSTGRRPISFVLRRKHRGGTTATPSRM